MLYQLTRKGTVRATLITIEDMVQERDIRHLNEQERASLQTDAQAIIDALGGRAMIEPERKSLAQALSEINVILGMADTEKRELNSLEEATIIHAAGSILLLLENQPSSD